MFWKKCVPWLGSTWKSGKPVSIITLALDISDQAHGIPNHLSVEPNLPAAINM